MAVSQRREWMIAVLLLALLIAVPSCGYQMVTANIQQIQIAFAAEQTAIFDQMVDKARDSLSQTPPDCAQAADCLNYLHFYYPSGTKQTTGTSLDQIVERHRSLCIAEVVRLLREATGEDHGESAELWIERFGKLDD